jgi:hypothetical protein
MGPASTSRRSLESDKLRMVFAAALKGHFFAQQVTGFLVIASQLVSKQLHFRQIPATCEVSLPENGLK